MLGWTWIKPRWLLYRHRVGMVQPGDISGNSMVARVFTPTHPDSASWHYNCGDHNLRFNSSKIILFNSNTQPPSKMGFAFCSLKAKGAVRSSLELWFCNKRKKRNVLWLEYVFFFATLFHHKPLAGPLATVVTLLFNYFRLNIRGELTETWFRQSAVLIHRLVATVSPLLIVQ